MIERRYDTEQEKKEILTSLDFFISSDNPDLVNVKEIKDLMDKLELKDKMPFIYNIIDSLCSNRDIRRKGGLTKDEFIQYLDEKMSDAESREGISTLYDVFTDPNSDTLPMTNFCRTTREIGDNEKDQELKELLENADMTGKELTFDEFYEIMKSDEGNKRQNLRGKKNQPSYGTKYSRKKYEKPEKEEPSEEKSSERNSYRNKKNQDQNNADYEPKNRYSYQRVKVEQTKNPKYEKPVYTQVKETHITKEVEPEDEKVEKKIVLEEIITTTEKEIEEPVNEARDKYKSRYNRNRDEDDGKTKKYSYQINRRVYARDSARDSKKEDDNNEKDKDEDNHERSDSKRYHRRYRDSNNKPSEQKTETTVTYNRYRRKF